MSLCGEGEKIIVILACLSRVVIVERWLLRLFVVSAAFCEEEESGPKGKDKGTTEPRRRK